MSSPPWYEPSVAEKLRNQQASDEGAVTVPAKDIPEIDGGTPTSPYLLASD